jgi:hypothetical protein
MLGRLYLLICCMVLVCVLQPAKLLAAQPSTITVYITVDWEGWSLEAENLEAIQTFRAKHPTIPMLHLLNPVYYLRPEANPRQITDQIRSALLPIDTIGLHLHGWQSLVQYCGIAYKDTPTFTRQNDACRSGECGYSVSLELAYSEQDLTQLIRCSADLLVKHGFEAPRHFRAGGWQFGPKLASALHQNSFSWDSSRIDADIVSGRWGEQSEMVHLLRALHPDASILDQPRALLPGLMQYPNNAGLMDYTRTDDLVEIFQTLIEQGQGVMVMGFHQETAFDFLDNMEDALLRMEEDAESAGVALIWGNYD